MQLHPEEIKDLIAWRREPMAGLVRMILNAKMRELPNSVNRADYREDLAAAQHNAARGVSELYTTLFEDEFNPTTDTPPETFEKG